MIKVAIYARVSSERQEKEKTIESQIAALKKVAEQHNVDIVKTYTDNGFSGELMSRPALDQLRDDAQNGVFEKLYIYSPDRLSRNHLNQLLIIRELKRHGVKIIFGDKPLDTQNKLLFDIESIIGEYEKKLILDRTRRGKLHKAKAGKIISSHFPFGYKFERQNEEKKLVIDENEAKVVRTIFDLYLDIQTICGVSKKLAELNIPSRINKRWRIAYVREILMRETYIGKWHFGRKEAVKPKNPRSKFPRLEKSSYRLKKDYITIPVPAIISKAKFEMVQNLLKKNHKVRNTTERFWLLRGLAYCPECGSRMGGDAKGKYRYYRCSNGVGYSERNCNTKSIPAEPLEDAVWKEVKRAVRNPKVLRTFSSVLSKKNSQRRNMIGEQKDLLTKLKEIKGHKNKLFDLYETDNIDQDILAERLGTYTEQEKQINKLLADIELRLKQMEKKDILFEKLQNFSKLFKSQLELFTQEEKRSFLQSIVEQVVYDPKSKSLSISGEITFAEKKEEVLTNSLATSPVLSQ